MLKPYYNEDSDFILYNGDCAEVMKGLDKCTVDLIFADPPYFLSSGKTVRYNDNEKTIYKGAWDETKSLDEINAIPREKLDFSTS